MSDQQLDLFSGAGVGVEQPVPRSTELSSSAADMDDEALVAAIPEASLADASMLAAEAGRRRLAAAIPALAALCRRFAGFGIDRAVPEQVAALQGLATIGGRDAADAVARMIERAVVQGPALKDAVCAAAQLRSRLSADVLRSLLRDAEPGVRADACRCARPLPELIAILVDRPRRSRPDGGEVGGHRPWTNGTNRSPSGAHEHSAPRSVRGCDRCGVVDRR